jgi:predicted DNA-binding protein
LVAVWYRVVTRRAPRNTHQTTIRFTDDLWIALERASARLGISVAQYVRDAARARLAESGPLPTGHAAIREVERANAIEHSFEHVENSAALWEQGRLARERSRLLREEAKTMRLRIPG